MTTEYLPTPTNKKPVSSLKKGITKRNRSTKRITRQKNAFYQLAQAYKSRHPKATAADAWRHMQAIAATGAHDVVLDYSSGIISYRPDVGKFGTREIKQRSFSQQYYRISNISP
ncbi:MAG: hypothetical protein EPO47_05105 [Rugosibacter sp.]|nr:MAG: hypothetical protein EPO60_04700 [Rugosibacter sp.]TBR09924.1 MAG: hypothetical protein EPO47_05105 [Rugosibacter sp.]